MKKYLFIPFFLMASPLIHAVIPAVLNPDTPDALVHSVAAAKSVPGHDSIVFIETQNEEGLTGVALDPWTILTIAHVPVTKGTKVVLDSVDATGSAKAQNDGKAALVKIVLPGPYTEAATQDLSCYRKHFEKGDCSGQDPFTKGLRHQDFQILKLDRPLSKISHFFARERLLPLGFQAWDGLIIGYPGSVIANGVTTHFDKVTQIALRNKLFYSHAANVLFTPFTGYTEKDLTFDVYPYMDPLAGITGNAFSGGPVIDMQTQKIIGLISGRLRQEYDDDRPGIALNLIQPLAPLYDFIQERLGPTHV